MGTTIVLFDIIDTPSRVARVAAAKYLRFRRNSPALSASAGEGDAECEENFETGAWGRAAGLPAKGGRPRLKLTGAACAACEMCATRRRRRGSDPRARRKHPPLARRARPRALRARRPPACHARPKPCEPSHIPKPEWVDLYADLSEMKTYKDRIVNLRFDPMTAPGSPVKFTNRIGTNSENPNVIR